MQVLLRCTKSKKCTFSDLLPLHPPHPEDLTALNCSVCILLGLSVGTHTRFSDLADYSCVFPKVIRTQYGKYYRSIFFKQTDSQLFKVYIYTLKKPDIMKCFYGL